MERVLSALCEVVGRDHVLVEPADLVSRNIDGRGTCGRALACVRPASASEVSAIMKIAAAYQVRIVPQGARTGLVGGGAADDGGKLVLLGLDRLSATPTVDPANRTVHAQAGVSLSDLNRAASAHGLVFPIDLGADPTVGGMIGANTGGARFLRYGDVRRNVLGIEAVLADGNGTRLDLGGALWKDNSTLDLKQMLIGASGSMGIVTGATLALHPLPASSVTAMVALDGEGAFDALLTHMEGSCGMLMTAFEGMSAAAYEAALAHAPRLRRPFPADAADYYLLIELSAGTLLDVQQLEEMLVSALAPWLDRGSGILDAIIGRGEDFWSIRHAIPDGLRAMGHVVGCDVSLRRGDVRRFRKEVGELIARDFPGMLVCDFGHVGDGGLHFNMVWPRDMAPPSSGHLDRARQAVFKAAVERYQGSFSAEHGIGPRNIAYYDRWTASATKALSGGIQSLFAPRGLGRVNFGPPNERRSHV